MLGYYVNVRRRAGTAVCCASRLLVGEAVNTDREAELEILIRAKYPIIYIVSWEERRTEESLRRLAAQRHKKLYGWTITEGIFSLETVKPAPVDPNARAPLQALEYVAYCREAAIFVLKDFHHFLDDTRLSHEHIVVMRKLRDIINDLKESHKTLVILSPVLKFPPELEKDVTVLDYGLPTMDELAQSLDRVLRSAKGLKIALEEETREKILHAARGLTCTEAENVFAKSLVTKRELDLDIIVAEKRQIIRKSRVLEYYESLENFDYVGGMDLLKDWLNKRALAFSEKARRFGLPEPKGLLLLGVQGAGKSLIAKAVASQWKLPLLRLDMGRVFSELVGSSEQNIRSALQTAESISPSILWLDELEKGLSGTASSNRSDAGTAARVFGSLLTWMQEKVSPVFVIGTSNDISMLPPEMLRKGRFDEIFFVDLPTVEERHEIFAIHLAKRGRDPALFDLVGLAREAEGFSGAEIEQVIIAGLYDAFEAEQDLCDEDLYRNIRQSIPLSQTVKEQISTLRDWARTHARPASSRSLVKTAMPVLRPIEI
jgi:SpoVK/Ycf46/Vps4 family AAA+-type ATPase